MATVINLDGHQGARPGGDRRLHRRDHRRARRRRLAADRAPRAEPRRSSSTPSAPAATAATCPPSLAAALIGIYQYYGFEACGDVAEEVPEPGPADPQGDAPHHLHRRRRRHLRLPGADPGRRRHPRRHRRRGRRPGRHPARRRLRRRPAPRSSSSIVLISFLSCAMSLQAAASRLTYSYGRDDMIIGSSLLKQFSPDAARAAVRPAGRRRRPGGHRDRARSSPPTRSPRSSASRALGIYIAFQMVVLAALRARLKGWVPSGKYTLGAWGLPVNIAALVYGVHRHGQHGVAAHAGRRRGTTTGSSLLSAAVVIGVGLVYMAVHPRRRPQRGAVRRRHPEVDGLLQTSEPEAARPPPPGARLRGVRASVHQGMQARSTSRGVHVPGSDSSSPSAGEPSAQRKAASPVSAWPTTRVCISTVPS